MRQDFGVRNPQPIDLLMEKRRKEKELPMLEGESVPAFSEAAFAKDYRLFPSTKRLADERPLLENRCFPFAVP